MARRTDHPPLAAPATGRAHRFARRAALLAVAATATCAAAPAVAGANTVEVTPPPIERPLPMKQTAVRVAIKNTSKRALSNLTLSVRPVKGVRVRIVGAKKGQSSRRLSTLRAGRTARVTVRVQRLKGGPQEGAVTVRVQRGKRTVGSERLRFGTPPLTGRYFWGSTFTLSGTRMETLYFSSDKLVFTDDMEGAWATCTAEDEKCRPYQYSPNAKANQLVIDGKPATLNGRKLEYDGQSYLELAAPPAGTRWSSVMTYANQSGICPLMCTFFRENLQFNADGTFVRTSVVSGTSPVVDWASVPPENRGTYEVRADKTIRLTFGDGKERIETIGVYVNDDGSLQSPTEGIVLDGDGYFDIRD